MATLQLLPKLSLNFPVRQPRRPVAGDEVLPASLRPPFKVIIQGKPLPRLSAQGIFEHLLAPWHTPEHRQIPRVCAMHPLVIRPTNEA